MVNIISLDYLWKKGFKIIHSGTFLFSLVDKDDEEIIKVNIVPNNNIREEDLTIKDILGALTNDIQVNIKALEKERQGVILKTKNNSILLKKNRDNHLSLLDDEIVSLKSILKEAVSDPEITITKSKT